MFEKFARPLTHPSSGLRLFIARKIQNTDPEMKFDEVIILLLIYNTAELPPQGPHNVKSNTRSKKPEI